MNPHHVHHGIAPHAWLQHHLPWLAVLAMVLGLFRHEDGEIGFDPDDLNG
jgi:hypothetical protein